MRKKPRKPARELLVETGKEVADHTLKASRDFAIGAGLAKTAPMWAPVAASVILWLGVLCLALSLMCGGISGAVTLVLTDNFSTAGIVGLIGLGLGAVSLPFVIWRIYRRIRRHPLAQAAAPHTKHVTKHAKRHILTALFGMFDK